MISLPALFILLGLTTFVTATRICNEPWPQEIWTHPAVGLEFGTSHGHAVFKWPNGTVETIATIPGDSQYLTIMTRIAECSVKTLYYKADNNIILSQNASSIVEGSCMFRRATELSLIQALDPMAQQLKLEVDVSLATRQLAMLGVTYPVFFDSNHQTIVQSVIRRVGMYSPSLTYFQTNAAVTSAAANGVGACGCPVLEQVCLAEHVPHGEIILHADYSDALLTVLLYEGRMWNERTAETNNGGILHVARSLPLSEPDAIQHSKFWNLTATAVQDMILTHVAGNNIDELVLSGNRATDRDLHNALYTAIGASGLDWHMYLQESNMEASDHEINAVTIAMGKGTMMVDSVIAPAQGAAHISWGLSRRQCIDPAGGWWRVPSLCGNPYNYQPRPRKSPILFRQTVADS